MTSSFHRSMMMMIEMSPAFKFRSHKFAGNVRTGRAQAFHRRQHNHRWGSGCAEINVRLFRRKAVCCATKKTTGSEQLLELCSRMTAERENRKEKSVFMCVCVRGEDCAELVLCIASTSNDLQDTRIIHPYIPSSVAFVLGTIRGNPSTSQHSLPRPADSALKQYTIEY